MKINAEFVKREVAGEHLLVPVGKTTLDLNGILTLNEVGAFLWDRLPDAKDEAALVDAVLGEYEADRPEVERDVAEFLDSLRKLNILG